MQLPRVIRTGEPISDEVASMRWSDARFHKTNGQGIIAPLAFARSLCSRTMPGGVGGMVNGYCSTLMSESVSNVGINLKINHVQWRRRTAYDLKSPG